MRSTVLESPQRTNRPETPGVRAAREHPASKPRLRIDVGASELAERLDGQRWALVTDDLGEVLDELHELAERLDGQRWALVTDDLGEVLDELQWIATPPSALLVPARQYLLAKAEFPAARVATHPDELRTCLLELAVSWDRDHAPRVRACLVVDGTVSDASLGARR